MKAKNASTQRGRPWPILARHHRLVTDVIGDVGEIDGTAAGAAPAPAGPEYPGRSMKP